jgi:hypothetical protein
MPNVYRPQPPPRKAPPEPWDLSLKMVLAIPAVALFVGATILWPWLLNDVTAFGHGIMHIIAWPFRLL